MGKLIHAEHRFGNGGTVQPVDHELIDISMLYAAGDVVSHSPYNQVMLATQLLVGYYEARYGLLEPHELEELARGKDEALGHLSPEEREQAVLEAELYLDEPIREAELGEATLQQ